MAATATRIGAAARGIGDTLSVVGPRKVQREPAGAGAASAALGSSPILSGDSSMLGRMRAVLQRHQCVQQQEAVSACMRQQKLEQPFAGQPCDCRNYINALLYCQQATAQHNYPSFANTAMLF